MQYMLLALFLLILLIHLSYYLGVFGFFFKKNKTEINHELPKISVIICAKNELENLQNFLPLVKAQNYPNFEIVVINDRSSDESLDYLETFQQNNTNVKIVDILHSEQFYGNKKYALTMGIKAASHDILLFTDADCKPASENWITEMVHQYTQEKQIVLGYGAYQYQKGLLNKLIRFETLMTALQYFSYAKMGIPYMGVGRNLLYHRSLFFENKGFNSHVHILSGDDDLLINQIANNKNTAIQFSSDAHTISVPKQTLKDWIQQKRRHISTSTYYKKKHQFLLGLYAINRLLFWIVTPIALFFYLKTIFLLAIITGIFLKFLTEWIIIKKAAKKLNEPKLGLLIPLLDLLLLILQLHIFNKNLFSKPKFW